MQNISCRKLQEVFLSWADLLIMSPDMSLNTLQLDENHERECKLAEGGLPESIGRPIRHLQY